MKKILNSTFLSERTVQQVNATEFLRHVMLGHDTEVTSLLEQNPELATMIACATDPSGRPIQMSGLIYAAWALDITMLRNLAPFLEQDLEKSCLQLSHSLDMLGDLGAKFNSQPLLAAYQKLTPADPVNCGDFFTHFEEHLFSLGSKQAELPLHFIHEMCRQDRSFVDEDGHPPKFDDQNLPRETLVNAQRLRATLDINSLRTGDFCLGQHFALYRGARKQSNNPISGPEMPAICIAKRSHGLLPAPIQTAFLADANAFRALFLKREQDVLEFVESLHSRLQNKSRINQL